MFSLSNLCFLCLGDYDNLKTVLIINSDEMSIGKKLKHCLPELDIDIHTEIPKYLCNNCISKLECLYNFKQTCLRNNIYLKNYLQTLTSTSESYKHLSVKLNDIKYQNKLSPVSTDETFTTERSDNDQRIEEYKIEKPEAVYLVDIKYEIDESQSLFEEKNDIVVKQEILTSEDTVDDEFYHVPVNSIKCDSILNDSDVSVPRIENIVPEDLKYCNTDSDSENNLIKPKENKIKKPKIFECSICNKKFPYRVSLEGHLKIHAGIKDLTCATCKKQFLHKRSLIRHETIHTGVRNYECTMCDKKFMDKSNLVRHERIHTGIKNFQCSICNKKFAQKTNLRKHEKVHSRIKISI